MDNIIFLILITLVNIIFVILIILVLISTWKPSLITSFLTFVKNFIDHFKK